MRTVARVVAQLAVAGVTASLLVLPAAAAPAARPSEAPPGAGRSRDVQDGPLVFGHRVASGYRPEHTLASYRLAIAMGADDVAPDLVAAKDRVLVVRHENEISTTTDVAAHPEFAPRRNHEDHRRRPVTGWFTEDFTLAEHKTLRAKERIPHVRPENALCDGRYEVPTLGEVISLVQAESKRLRRTVGIAPEAEHPTCFDGLGLSMEEPLVDSLTEAGLVGRRAPVVVQSFGTANLRQLDRLTRVPLLQLVGLTGAPYDRVVAGRRETYDSLMTDVGLRRIARSRVVDGSLTIGGRAVDAEQTYRVTVTSVLPGGGDGFATLREGTGAVTSPVDLDAFVTHLGASSPVTAAALDRIRTTAEAVVPAA